MTEDRRDMKQRPDALARVRAVAMVLAALLVLLGIALSTGLPAWLATPILMLLGVWERVGAGAGGPPRSVEELAAWVERERVERVERLRAIESLVDVVDIAAIGLDESGRVWLANNAARDLFGSGLVGREVAEIFAQPDIVGLVTAARRGASRQARVRLSRERGVVILEVSGVPLEAPPGAGPVAEDGAGGDRFGVVMTFRDVTELATAVQLKTDFVANASHELRTPLSAIRASVETIQDAAEDDPEARARFLRTIASAATRLEDLCRDLMDLSRVETADESVERGPVSMEAVAGELKEIFESACAARSLELGFEIDAGARALRTDARLLSLILRNLIENSTKFAFESTRIRVVVRPGQGEGEGGDGVGRGDLVIEVIDQGIGIPIGLQARIFERFFQADPARAGNGKRGTGLGLAIVKHAVRALGGRISVESVWKQGTTMRVELPDAIGTEAR